MLIRLFSLLMLIFLIPMEVQAENKIQNRPDWEKYFQQFEAQGTIVIADERTGSQTVNTYNEDRAKKRYSPASTFKIPHTLFALDAGILTDEFQVFKWDGTVRKFAPHNQDQTLRSAMRNSALWVYEDFAKKIGQERAQIYLNKLAYGNADPTTEHGNYWVDGKLAISAYEQVDFLKRLYRNSLPFSVMHQRLLKDVMIVEAGRDWILRAKTGWGVSMGWWVGWVEWPTGPVFFALNIDTPNNMADLPKREAITRAILHEIKALPAQP